MTYSLKELDEGLPLGLAPERKKPRPFLSRGVFNNTEVYSYYLIEPPEIQEHDHAPLYHQEEDEEPGDQPWAPPRQTLRPVCAEFETGDDDYAIEVFVALMFRERISQRTFEKYL